MADTQSPWHSFEEKPAFNELVLFCTPGATDLYYLVYWGETDDDEVIGWRSYQDEGNPILWTDDTLRSYYLLPMWRYPDLCPSSISRGSIVQDPLEVKHG